MLLENTNLHTFSSKHNHSKVSTTCYLKNIKEKIEHAQLLKNIQLSKVYEYTMVKSTRALWISDFFDFLKEHSVNFL